MNNLINIKSYLTFLSKNKGYTAINIFGLSISLMFVILIAVYVGQEMSVDKFHKNVKRIYALGNEQNVMGAGRIGYAMQERFPEIEKVCPVVSEFKNVPITINSNKYNTGIVFADSCFFDFFSFELIDGDKSHVLEAKNYAVISESFSNKAFPGKNPIGESIPLNDSVSVIINGVMKDIKNSTIPNADIVLRIEMILYYNSGIFSANFNNAGGAVVFILAKEGTDLPEKTEAIMDYFKEIYWTYMNDVWKKVTLTPLNDLYFSKLKSWQLNHGDKNFVLIFISVGLLILIFAIINYINLTVAQAGFRAKEMATRRLLGSSRKELFIRLIAESTLTSLISFALGLFFASIAVPYANNLLDTKLYLADNMTIRTLGTVLSLILLVGFVSGVLPATIMSNLKPMDVVRGSFRRKTKMVFSKFFITFQNTITIAMIAAAIIMVTQVNHLINAPLNYNKTNILNIESWKDREQMRTFGSEISSLACVKSVGYTQGTPFNSGNKSIATYKDKGKTISFQILTSDQATFDMLQIKKLRENNIASNGYYLNKQALKELEITEDTATFKFGESNILIAGVLDEFQLGNISNEKEALLYEIKKTEDFHPWEMLVEVQGDPFDAYKDIKKAFERMTGLEFHGEYIEDQIRQSYQIQYRTGQIVTIFTGIAILISLLGLLAMSTYFIQQRSREISVRKVFGSNNKQILTKLVTTFLNYVLIAFVIATPVVWYLMKNWLSDYEYRIRLSPVYFIIAGLFCLLISFVTVFAQSWHAATENPVKRLKTE